MISTSSCDLGHGVRVMPGDGAGLVVLSSDIDLGWRRRENDRPGSAVMWEGSGFEVVEHEPWRRGARWILEPWTSDDVMRVVTPLDGATVAAAARAAQMAAHAAQLRIWLWIGSPIFGFAAASRQRRWRDDFAFPATLASSLSAILEIAVGAMGVIEIFASAFGYEALFPWLPRPMVLLGLIIFIEGAVRLAQIAADPGPVGSLFGLPLEVLDRRGAPRSDPIQAPTVQAFDAANGALELLSTIYRRDWAEPGTLMYRGERFTLASIDRLVEGWIYTFHRAGDSADAPATQLRFAPPRSKMVGRSFTDQRGLIETIWLSIVVTMAPRRFQERWAAELGVRPIWFTVTGASAELLGSLVNLDAPGAQPALTVLLNLFFGAEAVVRFSSLVFRGRPLGSILGLPLATILERTLPKGGRSES